MGANATTMIASLSATCDKVNTGSPRVKRLQTNTIAVQGAAARMISPAIYSPIRSAGSRSANRCCRKSTASSAIENGFTNQLTNRVMPMPRA